MANICESVQGPSWRASQGRPQGRNVKVADRLEPKRYRGQEPGFNVAALMVSDGMRSFRASDVDAPICRCLRSRTPKVETSKAAPGRARIFASTGESPIFPPRFDRASSSGRGPGSFRFVRVNRGQRIVSDAHGGAGVGCWRKRMPSCNGVDTGSDICRGRPARRESVQTSSGCLSAEKNARTILNRESNGRCQLRPIVCAPSPSTSSKPGGSIQVLRSTLGMSVMDNQRAGRRRAALEGLEPYVWKLTCPVLRGAWGRQRPLAYLTAAIEQLKRGMPDD